MTSVVILLCFIITGILGPRSTWADVGAGFPRPIKGEGTSPLQLPVPGEMMSLSQAYMPVMIKGLKVHPENPLLFDFVVDTGNSGLSVVAGLAPVQKGRPQGSPLQDESNKLIKYFLASLTIPEKDLWVNLSPYEKDRIVPEELGNTELGRDMLAQDYILKQLTASLIYPEKDLGKKFWDKVYAKAQALYGNTQIPVNTFNKVWIVADKAKVLERNNVGYIVGAHLKVMLEEDYLANEKNQTPTRGHVHYKTNKNVSPSMLPSETALNAKAPQGNTPNALANQIIRDIILPELENEVNQGQNFAPLRQMFYSMILATWYKQTLKNTLLNQVYADKKKIEGIGYTTPTRGHVQVKINRNVSPSTLPSDSGLKLKATQRNPPSDVETIYHQYLQAYKKGVFNYIKEDLESTRDQRISRKYFSGGIAQDLGIPNVLQRVSTASSQDSLGANGDLAMASVYMARVHNKSKDFAMNSNVSFYDFQQFIRFAKKGDVIGRLFREAFENPDYLDKEGLPLLEKIFYKNSNLFDRLVQKVDQMQNNRYRLFENQTQDEANLIRERLFNNNGNIKLPILTIIRSAIEGFRIQEKLKHTINFKTDSNYILSTDIPAEIRSIVLANIAHKEFFSMSPLMSKSNVKEQLGKFLKRAFPFVKDDDILEALNLLTIRPLGAGDFNLDLSRNLSMTDVQHIISLLLERIDTYDPHSIAESLKGSRFTAPPIGEAERVILRNRIKTSIVNNLTHDLWNDFVEIDDLNSKLDELAELVEKYLSHKRISGNTYQIILKEEDGVTQYPEGFSKKVDFAMSHSKAAKINNPGGVDLSSKNMELDVVKEGKNIEMKFPAFTAQFQGEDFLGIEPMILRIVPLASPQTFLDIPLS